MDGQPSPYRPQVSALPPSSPATPAAQDKRQWKMWSRRPEEPASPVSLRQTLADRITTLSVGDTPLAGTCPGAWRVFGPSAKVQQNCYAVPAWGSNPRHILLFGRQPAVRSACN
jgi:hypothetical protein